MLIMTFNGSTCI